MSWAYVGPLAAIEQETTGSTSPVSGSTTFTFSATGTIRDSRLHASGSTTFTFSASGSIRDLNAPVVMAKASRLALCLGLGI